VQTRSTRATSLSRATSVPPSSTAFRGSTGFYARELAKARASSVERSSSVAAQSSSARATRSSSVPPTPGFDGYSGYYRQQLAAVEEARESSSAISSSIATSSTSKLESSMTAQELSIKQGRQSASRAVRRAELHASSSGRDPRHVGVPRDMSDDICYKVADLRMTPFESRELQSHAEASMRGRLRVQKIEKELSALTSSAMKYKSFYSKSAAQMAKEAIEASECRELQSHAEASMRGRLRVQKIEKELSALTSSAMKYKSFYSKSAAQMAKEAIEASECEAAESRKVRKTTIVESSKQVAAA